MTDNAPRAEPPIFSAVVTPHRSLSRTGFLVVMSIIAGISFVTGVFFIVVGAWPIMGFLGLDVLVIYGAFRANYRAARAFEEIEVTPTELRFRKVSQRGQEVRWTLNPLWTRLEREEMEDFGLQRLFLVSRGRRVSIADALSPPEREGFAKALSIALADARRGPVRNAL